MSFAADAVNLAVSVDEDFGDAPASYDPTAAASHVIGDLKLGTAVDTENTNVLNGGTATTPSPKAAVAGAAPSGDTDDAFSSLPSLTPGTYTLTVPISGASQAGQVCGWIDFDQGGTFNTTTEQACGTFSAGGTSVPITFTIPSGLTTGSQLYVRLRTAYGTGLTPTGRFDSGEVEDYRVLVGADVTIDKAAPVAVGSGGSLSYIIRVWNNGPSSVSGATITDTLPSGFTATGVTCVATGTATCGTQSILGGVLSAITGTLSIDTAPTNSTPEGNFLTYTITGTAPTNGQLSNTASANPPSGVTDPVSNNTSAAVITRIVDAVNDSAITVLTTGGTISVLGNDTVGGVAATTSNGKVSLSNNGGLSGVSVNGNGELVVPSGAAAGSYTVTYKLCDATLTTACDTATITVNVLAPPTITKSYSPTSIPANSTTTSTLTLTLGNSGSTAQTLSSALNDDIGSGLTITSVSGGTCNSASTSFSGTTVTYASGATIPAGGCTIKVTVKSGSSGSYPNTIPAGALVTNAGSNTSATTATLTVTPAADLKIVKSGPTTIVAGTQITYILTLTNAGPNAANGATFSDSAPTNLLNVTATCLNPSGGASGCNASVNGSNVVTGSVGTFPSGGSVQIEIKGTVPAGTTSTSLNNSASISVPGGVTEIDGVSNLSDTITTTITKSAALGVTKTNNLTAVTPGQVFTYVMVVSNGGPSSTTVNFVDNTFSGMTLSNWTCTGTTGTAVCPSGLPLSGGYSNSLLNVPTNSSITFQVTGTVTAVNGSVSNTVSITPPGAVTDTDGTANNAVTDTDPVSPIADLTIDKSATVAVAAGGTVTYTIRVWNNGPSAVSGASVTDTLPSGFTATSLSCAATGLAVCNVQTLAGNNVTITTGLLPSDITPGNLTPDGNFLTYTITGTAPAGGQLSNTAQVVEPLGVTDSNTSNNTSAAALTRIVNAVDEPLTTLAFGVGGTVSVLGNDTVGGAAATTSTSTVSISNNGGLSGLTVNSSGQLVVPSSTPAGSYTVTYKLCDATVTTACDTATAVINIGGAQADLASSKVSTSTVKPGGTVTYTIKVWNNGPNADSTASISDTVPGALTDVSWTCTASGTASCGTGGGTGNSISLNADLPVDAAPTSSADTNFVTITVTGTAPNAATLETTPGARSLGNTVTVVSSLTDPTPSNNSASATVEAVYLKLTKAVRNLTAGTAASTSANGLPGDVLEYCMEYNNFSNVLLKSFTITDSVPGNTSARLNGFDVEAAGAGYGVQLTRGATAAVYYSSAADADAGALTNSGGDFGAGLMTVSLGDLPANEMGMACFRVNIR